jgi:AraC-like DNA-binding protein
MKTKAPSVRDVAKWRSEWLEGQRAPIVAGRGPGPEPPRPWAPPLRELIEASREAAESPDWWTPLDGYFGSVETRTDPESYYWDGMKRVGRRDHPLVVFQFTFAGRGAFELYGREPEDLPPGTGFFAMIPSRHRYYLPPSSPGWTFAWIGIYHPYLQRRLMKQVELSGPLVRAAPKSPLIRNLVCLVRGAFHKDFRDRFDVERELLAFTHAYERQCVDARGPEGEQLLDELRKRVLAQPRARPGIADLAKERGMSPTAFSHHFRARTGLTPARFMTEVRVQLAARLLETTELPLSQIARHLGFANANHFGKVFRRFRPQSAGAYRRSIG